MMFTASAFFRTKAGQYLKVATITINAPSNFLARERIYDMLNSDDPDIFEERGERLTRHYNVGKRCMEIGDRVTIGDTTWEVDWKEQPGDSGWKVVR